MISSWCICQKKRVLFRKIIQFSLNDHTFPHYRGLSIAQCQFCKVLKTIPIKRKKQKTEPISTAKHYEDNSVAVSNSFQALIEKLKHYLTVQSTVLDVGCSTGIFLTLLKQFGYKTYGVEPNKSAMTIAQKKLKKNIFHGTLPSLLKINKKQFDCIVYNHTLEHIENVGRELTLIRRCLQKNGLLVVGVPNTSNIVYLIRKKYWESLLPDQHIWHFHTNYIKQLLIRYGFSILDISFSNHTRSDYPFLKKIYFQFLILCNSLFRTGEAVLIIARK